MIDKAWRLQRYQRKDYSELVDFPVEIVGRDGLVRRYAFEDSVRLYQRRITFAALRYQDPDLSQAEVLHCHARIAQLRRSYFYHHGWGTPEGAPSPAEQLGPLAGEVAAFLCRVLRCSGRPDVQLEARPDGTGAAVIWAVRLGGPEEQALRLYVYDFGPEQPADSREAFFAGLRESERSAGQRPDGSPKERLVAFHHTLDCGLLLMAAGEDWPAALESQSGPSSGHPSPGPWEQVLDLARHGDLADALVRCRRLVREQPYHRKAYLLGAALASHLGQPLVSEDLALVGRRYFPGEYLLHYYVGLGRCRSGRIPEALRSLEEAVRLRPRRAEIALLWVGGLVRSDQPDRALHEISEWIDAWDVAHADALALRDGLRARQGLMRLAAATAALGVLFIAVGAPGVAILAGCAGLAAVGSGQLGLARRLRRADSERLDDVGHALRYIKRLSRRPARFS